MEKISKLLTLNKVESSLFTFIFTLVGLGYYFALTNVEYFNNVYTVEDGLLENITVLFLLLGAVVSFYRYAKLRNIKPKLFVRMCFLVGLVFIFGAGEEISWGQRILGIETPEFFAKYNSQHETNLHNLRFGNFGVNKTIFGLFLGLAIAFYTLILSTLYEKVEWTRRIVDRFALPLPRLIHILFYLLLFLIVETIPSPKKGEVVEFGGAAIFILIFLYPRNSHIFRLKKD